MTFAQAKICKGCWQQMRVPVPLRGIASAPFRAFGIRPSRMNPNTCTICELMFTKVMKARHVSIDATVLFADLRDYTGLSQAHSAGDRVHAPRCLLRRMRGGHLGARRAVEQDHGRRRHGGLQFPDPARRPCEPGCSCGASDSATLQRQARARSSRRSAPTEGRSQSASGSISGKVSFGEFGRTHHDLTAIGTVVNTASRAQSAAASGEILVTQAVYEGARSELTESSAQDFRLKGFEAPVRLWAA